MFADRVLPFMDNKDVEGGWLVRQDDSTVLYMLLILATGALYIRIDGSCLASYVVLYSCCNIVYKADREHHLKLIGPVHYYLGSF